MFDVFFSLLNISEKSAAKIECTNTNSFFVDKSEFKPLNLWLDNDFWITSSCIHKEKNLCVHRFTFI